MVIFDLYRYFIRPAVIREEFFKISPNTCLLLFYFRWQGVTVMVSTPIIVSSTPLSYTAWQKCQWVWFHSHHWFSSCHSFAIFPDSTLNFPYRKLEYTVGILNLKFFLKQKSIHDNCCFVKSHIWLLVTPRTAARQTSLSFTIFQSLLKLVSIESGCHPTILFSVAPFSCPQSVPESGSFPMSWLFTSGGQSTGASASASILPMSIQGWFPLWFTSLISLLYKGLFKVLSSTTVRKHQFSGAQPSLWSISHIGTWLLEKITALTIRTFVGKVKSSLFNMLSRFIIAFLSRRKSLLISWLQSLSAVITMGHV